MKTFQVALKGRQNRYDVDGLYINNVRKCD